ncbi:hypothetical protein IAT38_002048 [Cryptococcus sp. DSM 104549]
MSDEFQSLSKGVFVIPFQPPEAEDNAEAGPSSRTLLDQVYDVALQRFEKAYAEYDADKTGEQLDDIIDWLERGAAPPALQITPAIHRLPVAILQNASSSLAPQLEEKEAIGATAITIHGREAADLGSAVRAVSIGFIGEATLSGKKTGRTGMDEVELWWKSRKNKTPLLVHIQDAQVIPSTVLAELTYILSIHTILPIRLLLSVPSTAVFLSSWAHIEPSSIDLCLLHSGRSRRRANAGGVDAILETRDAPMSISEELAEDIRADEGLVGGGHLAALKAVKWLFINHSLNSPLAKLVANDKTPEQERKLAALIQAVLDDPEDESIPGKALFKLSSHPNMTSVLNPAPRVSILHALSNPENFIPNSTPANQPTNASTDKSLSDGKRKASTQNGSARKRRANGADENTAEVEEEDGEKATGEGELRELQTLFELWKGAGKSVNLWDWLEGFRMNMAEVPSENGPTPGDGGKEGEAADGVRSASRKPADENEDEENGELETKRDEENEARLHAVFIRFVEEARMMGLVRAKGKKADELVKGVGIV